jgi:hypothetical protein
MNRLIRVFGILTLLASACTGKLDLKVTSDQGGMVIRQGETLTVDLQDLVAMNLTEYKVELKSISNDFNTPTSLYDLNDFVASQVKSGATSFSLTLPKSVGTARPILIVVEIPAFNNAQFVDVIFKGQDYVRPGIASSLSYRLIKSYGNRDTNGSFVPAKLLNSYQREQFEHIRTLVQARIDFLTTSSESLNWSTTPYERLIRYFTNGLSSNIAFLNAIKVDGVDYTWDTATPLDLVAQNTPENSLDNYRYAVRFKINGQDTSISPFNQFNAPAQLLSKTGTEAGIVDEGSEIVVNAQGYDPDQDFIDKNFQVIYTPRILPAGTQLVNPERTRTDETFTRQGAPDSQDTYRSGVIAYSEALSRDTIQNNPGTATANRDVYYLISDGLMYIPYRWNFSYNDRNRAPRFFTNQNGGINQTDWDQGLIPQTEQASTAQFAPQGWFQHASHCELNTTSQNRNPDHVDNEFAAVTSRANGPWSCVFKVYDPDREDDPNGSVDQLFFNVTISDPTVSVNGGFFVQGQQAGGQLQQSLNRLLPVYVSDQQAPRSTPILVNNCTDVNGVQHPNCEMGIISVTIDNSVKDVAGRQQSSSFDYTINLYDRQQAGQGMVTNQTVSRLIKFIPEPPRLINFSSLPPTANLPSLTDRSTDASPRYLRTETFFQEIMNRVDPTGQTTMQNIGFQNSIGAQARARAFGGANTNRPQLSSYFTQPYQILSPMMVFNQGGQLIHTLMGGQNFYTSLENQSVNNALTQSGNVTRHSYPRQFDLACNLTANNQNLNDPNDSWDQHQAAPAGQPNAPAMGGWVFELNAIDYDNIGLSVTERADPVYISLSHDFQNQLNANGITFCQYQQPLVSAETGETYSFSPNVFPNVNNQQQMPNPDACTTWATAPTNNNLMQPVMVYYNDPQNPGQLRKLVYHRIRMKWQPKNTSILNVTQASAFIQNALTNIRIAGNRGNSSLIQDTLDRSDVAGPLSLFALKTEMQPCSVRVPNTPAVETITSIAGSTNGLQLIIRDENRTFGSQRQVGNNALIGRYEMEVILSGTRTINDLSFLKYVPFLSTCHFTDPATMNPPTFIYNNGAQPLPTPIMNSTTPFIFYSKASDQGNLPRTRLMSASLDANMNDTSRVCIKLNRDVLQKSGQPYNEVLVLRNLNAQTTQVSLNALGVANGCALTDVVSVSADQLFVAIPSTCGGNRANAQTQIFSDANYALTSYVLTPQSYGFPSNFPIANHNLSIFPDLYSVNIPTVADSANALRFISVPVNSFVYDSQTLFERYTGYNGWVPNDNAVPGFNVNPTNYTVQYLDTDQQPIRIGSVNQPDPTSNVYWTSSNTEFKIYVKNNATANLDFFASDSTSDFPNDVYDVMQFTLVPPTTGQARNSPQLQPIPTLPPSRTSCVDQPANYAANLSNMNRATLYSTLRFFDRCRFSWTPSVQDVGLRYTYDVTTQDNQGAIGAPNNVSGTSSNGPTVPFKFVFQSLETNSAPFFKNGANTNTNVYNNQGGSAGWTTVFANNGVQGNHSIPTGFQINSGNSYSDSLRVENGDILINTEPFELVEGTMGTFTVNAGDSNATAELKKVLFRDNALPTSVLLIHDNGTATYQMTSNGQIGFETLSSSVVGDTTTFRFSLTPTDAHARFLSSTQGFLIPITITDTQYKPDSSSSFPSQFVVNAMEKKGWLWAKLKVKNSVPLVQYRTSSTSPWRSLESNTLNFETDVDFTMNLRVLDDDTTRLSVDNSNGFSPVLSDINKPSFLSIQNMAANSSIVTEGTARKVQHTFEFKVAKPTGSQIGSYNNIKISITDPGDLSLGYALNKLNGSSVSNLDSNGNNLRDIFFNIQIKGKPLFLAPSSLSPLLSRANAYVANPFHYPISMNISRDAEKPNKEFFVGIQTASPTPIPTPVLMPTPTPTPAPWPIRTATVPNGLFVTDKFVLKWGDSATGLTNPQSSHADAYRSTAIPLIGILRSYCSATQTTATVYTLWRYNSVTSNMEPCYLTKANYDANAAAQSLTVNLESDTDRPTFISTADLGWTEVVRGRTLLEATTEDEEINAQFLDFYGRCPNCKSDAAIRTINGATLSASPLSLTADNNVGSVEYLNSITTSGITSSLRYTYNFTKAGGNNAFRIEKKYRDEAPSRSNTNLKPDAFMALSAFESETLNFSAKLNITQETKKALQFRWYVNGCLRSSGLTPNDKNDNANYATIRFDLPVVDTSSGVNNDCSGQYVFNESNASSLGTLFVRLQVTNGTEDPAVSTSGSNTLNYAWKINVINNKPTLMQKGSIAYPPSDEIVLTGANRLLGTTTPVDFAMSVPFGNASYFTYTDRNTTNGLTVRMIGLTSGGSFDANQLMTLNCRSGTNKYTNSNALKWFGVQPDSSKVVIAASSNDNYDLIPSKEYGSISSTCYDNRMSLMNPNSTAIPLGQGSESSPAGFLAFSGYTQSIKTTSFMTSGTTEPWSSSSTVSNYFFMFEENARSSFWSKSVKNNSVYGATFPEKSNYPGSNSVRKNIVSGSYLIQLIGASSSTVTNPRGFIKISKLKQNSNPTDTLVLNSATDTKTIAFAESNETSILPNRNFDTNIDCNFKGTPLTGVYDPTDDSVYALVADATSGSDRGRLVKVIRATQSNPQCTVLDSPGVTLLKPSLNVDVYNPNITKMVIDTERQMIYGLIVKGSGQPSQLFSLDLLTKRVGIASISSSIEPQTLIYSPRINAVHVFDNRKASATTPALYKIW